MKNRKANITFHAMMAPGMIFILIFNIIPLGGLMMAFQNFLPAKGLLGSKWVGLDNFKFMFQLPDSRQIFVNTLVIAVSKMLLNLLVPLVFALMLNAVRCKLLKKDAADNCISAQLYFLGYPGKYYCGYFFKIRNY